MNRQKNAIKYLISRTVQSMVGAFSRSAIGRFALDQVTKSLMNSTRTIKHGEVDLTFSMPNSLNHYRIDTFSTKEPETLEWIDRLPFGSVVWDIGANIGLYTCYAAKARGCKVFAFEPSVFNLELLARNVFLNSLSNQVVMVPIPLSNNIAVNTFNMTSMEWGGALSSFGQLYGQDGESMNKLFEFQTIGVSMADALTLLDIPQPDFIKMDVDGIEHLILSGGAPVLKNAKGVLIEIDEKFEAQFVDSERYLSDAGLVLREKRHAEMFNDTVCFNQIWVRPQKQ